MEDLKLTIEYNGHVLERRYKIDPDDLPEGLDCFEIRDIVEYLNDFDNEINRLANPFF